MCRRDSLPNERFSKFSLDSVQKYFRSVNGCLGDQFVAIFDRHICNCGVHEIGVQSVEGEKGPCDLVAVGTQCFKDRIRVSLGRRDIENVSRSDVRSPMMDFLGDDLRDIFHVDGFILNCSPGGRG